MSSSAYTIGSIAGHVSPARSRTADISTPAWKSPPPFGPGWAAKRFVDLSVIAGWLLMCHAAGLL